MSARSPSSSEVSWNSPKQIALPGQPLQSIEEVGVAIGHDDIGRPAGLDSRDAVVLDIENDNSLVNSGTIPLGINPAGQVLGDFNGDGILDAAIVPASSGQVVVRLVNSQGQLLPRP